MEGLPEYMIEVDKIYGAGGCTKSAGTAADEATKLLKMLREEQLYKQ
jgi:hypothetical protein